MYTTKKYLKSQLRQAWRMYVRAFYSFSCADLANALRGLGVNTGDTLLVHSSYDAFHGFAGKPMDVIALLQEVIGPTGTVMMLTLPFTGTAVDYVRLKPVFDVRRTPSRMGLLSELFRRKSDVLRSVHPTHSVAVWGRSATELVHGHHLASTPCGAGSPFTRLLERRGKILLMGTDIAVMTFYHAVEELLEKKIPESPFTREVFVLPSRDYSDNVVFTSTRLFEPAISRRRNLNKLIPHLREKSAWRERHVGRLQLTSINADDVLATVSAMADKGQYCYD
jgi:aminoglycoside 3-N-acetyltransferase